MSDIINCYHSKFSGGIGDFLKGSSYLYKQAIKYGLSIDIDWRQHPINQFISSDCDVIYDPEAIIDIEDLRAIQCKNSNNWQDNMQDWIDKIVTEVAIDHEYRPATISSWFSDLDKYHGNDKHIYIKNSTVSSGFKTLIQKKLQFSPEIEKLFKKNKYKNYAIIHFRLGDRHTLPNIEESLAEYNQEIKDNYNLTKFNHDYDYYYYLIKKQIKNNNFQNTIIMSDSNDFKKFVKEESNKKNNIHVLHFNSNHTAQQPGLLKYTDYNNGNGKNCYKDTAMDLKYVINSIKNVTYSCYAWGSGFVVWPSKIYDIPLEVYNLVNNKILV